MQTVPGSTRNHSGAMPRFAVAAAEVCAVALLAFILARGFWFLMYGAFSEPFMFEEPEARLSIREVRLQPTDTSFDTLFSGAGTGAQAADLAELPETQLSLSLFGVRMGETPESGSAIIEVGANGQRTYAVGQNITDDATLAAVHADRIVIDRSGIREGLYLRDGADRPESGTGLQPVTDPQVLIAALGLQPNFDSGRLNGFRVGADDGTVQELGLEQGDIILAINGRDLPQDAEAAARLLQRFQSISSLQLTVRRDGERITLDVPR